MYKNSVACLKCQSLPYAMEGEDQGEGDCAVCLGPAVVFCEQCRQSYCKECNVRRHCRLPDHQFVRLSQVSLPRPIFGGETISSILV